MASSAAMSQQPSGFHNADDGSQATAPATQSIADDGASSGTGPLTVHDSENGIGSATASHELRKGASLRTILKKMLPVGLAIVAISWINVSHTYGAFYDQAKYVKRGQVAVVDFDGGAMGQSLLQAAAVLNRTHGYPTYVVLDATASSPGEVRHDVFAGKYWSALYASPGSTDRWQSAVNGSSNVYDPQQTLSFITMAARYYTFYQGSFYATDKAVVSVAESIFTETTVQPALNDAVTSATAPLSNAALSALTAPMSPIEVYAAKNDFSFFNRALINTIGTVIPIIMQFFAMMAFNGIANSHFTFASHSETTNHLMRDVAGAVWALITALCSVGWTYAFRGDSPLPAKEFFAAWAVTWTWVIINFNFLFALTTFVPQPFVPFPFFTWMIGNVVAALSPPEILNHWYRVNYFFRSLHWWQTLITIYTQGGVNHLRYNLPVLAAWLIATVIVGSLATSRRTRLARSNFENRLAELASDEKAPHATEH